MTKKEAEERLAAALGPFFPQDSHSLMLTEEGFFALSLIKALEALDLIRFDSDAP
jgi:hypothetical protein